MIRALPAIVVPALVLPTLLAVVPTGEWPVPQPRVLSGFRPPDQPWQPGHRGVDIAAGPGTVVLAMAEGTVAFVGRVAGKPVVSLALAGPGQRRLTYEPVVTTLVVGTRLAAGDAVGTVAASGGHCGGGGDCVHVGLRTASGYADPLRLVVPRPAVLKPT